MSEMGSTRGAEHVVLTEAEQDILRDVVWPVDPPNADPGNRLLYPRVTEAVQRIIAARLAPVEALADRWERENRRPSGPEDQVAAGVWSATKADAAELRAVLRNPPVSRGSDDAGERP